MFRRFSARLGPKTPSTALVLQSVDFRPNLAPQPTKWPANWLVLELVCRADLLGTYVAGSSLAGNFRVGARQIFDYVRTALFVPITVHSLLPSSEHALRKSDKKSQTWCCANRSIHRKLRCCGKPRPCSSRTRCLGT